MGICCPSHSATMATAASKPTPHRWATWLGSALGLGLGLGFGFGLGLGFGMVGDRVVQAVVEEEEVAAKVLAPLTQARVPGWG